jgi:hypothetical protein
VEKKTMPSTIAAANTPSATRNPMCLSFDGVGAEEPTPHLGR